MKTLFRYEEKTYSRGADEWENNLPGYTLEVTLHKYPIVKHTPKGVWIAERYDTNKEPFKFVLLSANKRWACPTEEEAKKSFIARKNRQIRILQHRLHRAKLALELVYLEPSKRKRTVYE